MIQDKEITFIQAQNSELEEALHFFKMASMSLSKKQVSQWSYWVDPPEEKITWVKEGFDNGEFFFVYDQSGNKIAMFRLLEKDTLYWGKKGTEKNTRYVHSLVVPPLYSGQGIGQAVILKIIDQLKQDKIEKFRLDCDGSNQRLCEYYESYGFVNVGKKTTNYAVNNLYEMLLT